MGAKVEVDRVVQGTNRFQISSLKKTESKLRQTEAVETINNSLPDSVLFPTTVFLAATRNTIHFNEASQSFCYRNISAASVALVAKFNLYINNNMLRKMFYILSPTSRLPGVARDDQSRNPMDGVIF
jgi:hypothetical protein